MFYNRTITSALSTMQKMFPVILITGPRQVGKSSILKEFGGEEFSYVSLDDPVIRAEAQNDPGLFLQKRKTPLIIDEVQYAPNLFTYIKIAVDEDRQNGMFWLIGSQKFHLMKGVSESLAGRIGILDMLGLSQAELMEKPEKSIPFLPVDSYRDTEFESLDINSVYEKIWRGSFPELHRNPDLSWDKFYSAYIQTYIQRDIRDLSQVADEQAFLKFLQAAAVRTGQLLNYNDMSKDVGVSLNTIRHWISLLETSGIIYILRPYHNNLTKRIIKTPKLYFLDTGLCAYLAGWSNPNVLERGPMSGEIFETYVISEIIKSYWHNGKSIMNLYYYRDRDQKEIDLLIEQDWILYPIEIKKKSNPDKHDIKNFSVLEKFTVGGKTIGNGSVICLHKDWGYLNEKNLYVNVGVI